MESLNKSTNNRDKEEGELSSDDDCGKREEHVSRNSHRAQLGREAKRGQRNVSPNQNIRYYTGRIERGSIKRYSGHRLETVIKTNYKTKIIVNRRLRHFSKRHLPSSRAKSNMQDELEKLVNKQRRIKQQLKDLKHLEEEEQNKGQNENDSHLPVCDSLLDAVEILQDQCTRSEVDKKPVPPTPKKNNNTAQNCVLERENEENVYQLPPDMSERNVQVLPTEPQKSHSWKENPAFEEQHLDAGVNQAVLSALSDNLGYQDLPQKRHHALSTYGNSIPSQHFQEPEQFTLSPATFPQPPFSQQPASKIVVSKDESRNLTDCPNTKSVYLNRRFYQRKKITFQTTGQCLSEPVNREKLDPISRKLHQLRHKEQEHHSKNQNGKLSKSTKEKGQNFIISDTEPPVMLHKRDLIMYTSCFEDEMNNNSESQILPLGSKLTGQLSSFDHEFTNMHIKPQSSFTAGQRNQIRNVETSFPNDGDKYVNHLRNRIPSNVGHSHCTSEQNSTREDLGKKSLRLPKRKLPIETLLITSDLAHPSDYKRRVFLQKPSKNTAMSNKLQKQYASRQLLSDSHPSVSRKQCIGLPYTKSTSILSQANQINTNPSDGDYFHQPPFKARKISIFSFENPSSKILTKTVPNTPDVESLLSKSCESEEEEDDIDTQRKKLLECVQAKRKTSLEVPSNENPPLSIHLDSSEASIIMDVGGEQAAEHRDRAQTCSVTVNNHQEVGEKNVQSCPVPNEDSNNVKDPQTLAVLCKMMLTFTESHHDSESQSQDGQLMQQPKKYSVPNEFKREQSSQEEDDDPTKLDSDSTRAGVIKSHTTVIEDIVCSNTVRDKSTKENNNCITATSLCRKSQSDVTVSVSSISPQRFSQLAHSNDPSSVSSVHISSIISSICTPEKCSVKANLNKWQLVKQAKVADPNSSYPGISSSSPNCFDVPFQVKIIQASESVTSTLSQVTSTFVSSECPSSKITPKMLQKPSKDVFQRLGPSFRGNKRSSSQLLSKEEEQRPLEQSILADEKAVNMLIERAQNFEKARLLEEKRQNRRYAQLSSLQRKISKSKKLINSYKTVERKTKKEIENSIKELQVKKELHAKKEKTDFLRKSLLKPADVKENVKPLDAELSQVLATQEKKSLTKAEQNAQEKQRLLEKEKEMEEKLKTLKEDITKKETRIAFNVKNRSQYVYIKDKNTGPVFPPITNLRKGSVNMAETSTLDLGQKTEGKEMNVGLSQSIKLPADSLQESVAESQIIECSNQEKLSDVHPMTPLKTSSSSYSSPLSMFRSYRPSYKDSTLSDHELQKDNVSSCPIQTGASEAASRKDMEESTGQPHTIISDPQICNPQSKEEADLNLD